jgi:hypothetical protein
MTIFIGILMPLSIRWLSARWHAGIVLHMLINELQVYSVVDRSRVYSALVG